MGQELFNGQWIRHDENGYFELMLNSVIGKLLACYNPTGRNLNVCYIYLDSQAKAAAQAAYPGLPWWGSDHWFGWSDWGNDNTTPQEVMDFLRVQLGSIELCKSQVETLWGS